MRLSGVISRTLVLPLCRDALGVFYSPSRLGYVLPDCQHEVNGPGRIAIRNCRFSKKLKIKPRPSSRYRTTLEPASPACNFSLTCSNPRVSFTDEIHSTTEYPITDASKYFRHPHRIPTKILLALSRLFPYKRTSFKELSTSFRALPVLREVEERCRSYPFCFP